MWGGGRFLQKEARREVLGGGSKELEAAEGRVLACCIRKPSVLEDLSSRKTTSWL